MERREMLVLAGSLTSTVSIAGCSSSSDGPSDSDGDGMVDSQDYAPKDPQVQEKADATGQTGSGSAGTATDQERSDDGSEDAIADTGQQDSGGQATETVRPRIGQVDVDIQSDFGQNNIGFDVEAYFPDSAVLTVQISDGEMTDQRSLEGTTTTGTMQELNDDIDPPDSFVDNEEFVIRFVLSINGESVDRKRFTHIYSE